MNDGSGSHALDPWTSTRHGGVVVMVVDAPRLFDPALVDRLDAALRAAVGAHDDLVLDLARVRFISSAMLGRLVMMWLAAQARGHHVLLAGVTGTLAEILRIAGLDRRLRLYPDTAAALAALPGRAS